MDEGRRCQDPHCLCANNWLLRPLSPSKSHWLHLHRPRWMFLRWRMARPPPRYEEPCRLCANDCGFFGSPATDDFCSKCYREIQRKVIAGASLIIPSAMPDVSTIKSNDAAKPAEEEPKRPAGPSSCACPNSNKKVGVIGFKCKCGEVYCRGYRLPEEHDCNFDYKSLGREKIEKANPVVKAEKLHKI